MIEGLAILDAQITSMTISKSCQPLDRQWHVAPSPHYDRHVDDRLGREPRHGGAADVFDATCYVTDNRPDEGTKLLKPPRPFFVVINYADSPFRHFGLIGR